MKRRIRISIERVVEAILGRVRRCTYTWPVSLLTDIFVSIVFVMQWWLNIALHDWLCCLFLHSNLMASTTLVKFVRRFIRRQTVKPRLEIAMYSRPITAVYLLGSAGKGSDQKYSWSSASVAVMRSRGSRVRSLSISSDVSFPRLPRFSQTFQKVKTFIKRTNHKPASLVAPGV